MPCNMSHGFISNLHHNDHDESHTVKWFNFELWLFLFFRAHHVGLPYRQLISHGKLSLPAEIQVKYDPKSSEFSTFACQKQLGSTWSTRHFQ